MASSPASRSDHNWLARSLKWLPKSTRATVTFGVPTVVALTAQYAFARTDGIQYCVLAVFAAFIGFCTYFFTRSV